jgi:hypothetical protein
MQQRNYIANNNNNQTNPTTGAAGYYQFTNLAPGDYIVMFMAPLLHYKVTSANTTTDANDSDADPYDRKYTIDEFSIRRK